VARGNSFEGGSNGVTLTQGGGGNTGGASGDVLDTVDATGTVTFSTAQAAHGSVSMLVSTGVSALAYGGYTLSSATTDYVRCYIRLTALPGVVQILTRYLSGASQSLRVNVKAAGTLEVRDAGNSVVGTTTSAVSINTWWRLEMFTTFSATVGAVQLRLYNTADGTSITDSLNLSGLTLTANATALRFGVGAAAASVPTTYYDDIAVEGATWHGPAVRSMTLSGIAVPAAVGDPALAQSLSVVPAGIAVPAAAGTTDLSQAYTVTPSGIAIPASVGDPAASQSLAVVPSGIAVGVAVGTLAVAFQPPAESQSLTTGTPSTAWRARTTRTAWRPTGTATTWKTGRIRAGGA
jgi:hypothetical protein